MTAEDPKATSGEERCTGLDSRSRSPWSSSRPSPTRTGGGRWPGPGPSLCGDDGSAAPLQDPPTPLPVPDTESASSASAEEGRVTSRVPPSPTYLHMAI